MKKNYIEIGTLDSNGKNIDQYFITHHLGENTFYIGKNKVHCELCESSIARFGPLNIVLDGTEEVDGVISFAFGYTEKNIPKKTEVYKKFKKYYDENFFFTISREILDDELFKRIKKPFNYVLKTPYLLDKKDIKIEILDKFKSKENYGINI